MQRAFFPAALLVIAVLAMTAGVAHADPTCTRFASPDGSDAAAGSIDAPLQTVQALADSLQPGETGCLRGGDYEGDVKITGPGISLVGMPNEGTTIVGRLWIAQGADNVTIENLFLDGTNSNILPSPTVNANNAVFSHDDVTNNHTAICFNLGHSSYGEANGTVIEYSRIHDCGVLPAANHDHGIYISRASDTVIRNNWIYRNADRGIQLFPNAQNTTITGNVIDSNGQGIIFGGLSADSSDHTRVSGNVITNSKVRYNVESYYDTGTPPGEDNRVTDNCISGGVRGGTNDGIATNVGFTATANIDTPPAFVNRAAADYRLAAGSACASVVPQPNLVPGADGGTAARTGPAVVLKVQNRRVDRLGRVQLRGKLKRSAQQGVSVAVMVRTARGHWWQLAHAHAHVDRRGRFHLSPRLRVGHGRHTVRLRAKVRGVGESHSVRIRVRNS